MKRHTTRDGWWEFVPTLRNRTPFKTSGALQGEPTYGELWTYSRGELPGEYWDKFITSGATYVVYSYLTPIAWENADGSWTVPDVKYSVTTSRHQSKIAAAVEGIKGNEV